MTMMRCLLMVPLVLVSHVSRADPCEDLRARISERMRAGGLVNPTLSVVENSALAAGRVVGTCGQGTKKIVYLAGESAAGGATPTRRKPGVIWTECKDGSLTLGDCKP